MRILLFLLFILGGSLAYAGYESKKFAEETPYVVRLKNGDMLTGFVAVVPALDSADRSSIKLTTQLGAPTIYLDEIAEITPLDSYYRHKHRHYLLPTGISIKDDHFVGDFEALFFYAGAGITDYVSVTFGRSIAPFIPSSDQLSLLNFKATLYSQEWDTFDGGMDLAVGSNLAFVNHNNRLVHFFTSTSFRLPKSILTGAVFYKTMGKDLYELKFGNERVNLNYPDGSWGLALGLDTRFTQRKDLHFVGEIWNSDITRPTNTGILVGLRLANTTFAADFGISYFTAPFFAPYFSFVWTPASAF